MYKTGFPEDWRNLSFRRFSNFPTVIFVAVFDLIYGGVVKKIICIFVMFLFCCCTIRAVYADCSPGYTAIINSLGDTIVAPMSGMCEGGYRLQDVPEELKSANGYSKDVKIPLCDGYWSETTCMSHSSSDCLSGQHGIFYDHVVMAPMVGKCEAGYQLRTMNDALVLTNGFVTAAEIPLGTVSYTKGDCPDGYFDLAVNDDSFFKVNTSGACSAGYKYMTEQCKSEMPDSPMICGILCAPGLEYTDVGTCSELCGGTHKSLRTSTGLIYPMYSTKSVTPSLNIKVGDTVCHVNLINGVASESINIKYNNKTYHAVK